MMLCVEERFAVKVLTDYDELEKSHKLRHEVFSNELGWVPQSDGKKEIDKYDNYAVPFGVLSETGELDAYLRLIRADLPYMLEEIFGCLVGEDHTLRKDIITAEISRLCVSPDSRDKGVASNFGAHRLSMLLYKGVYHWCRQNDIRYLYLVVEKKIFRLLRAFGFPCQKIGDPVRMQDGVEAVAAIMDWDEFDTVNKEKRPELYSWFSQDLLVPDLTP